VLTLADQLTYNPPSLGASQEMCCK